MKEAYKLRIPSSYSRNDIPRGEIYELYCYDKLIPKYPDITFLLKTSKTKKVYQHKTGFNYIEPCRIVYTSNRIDIGEFDILGIKGKILYWWEITLNKNIPVVMRKIEKKRELIKMLFPDFEIKLSIVSSNLDFIHQYNSRGYNTEIIDEPDYSEFTSLEYVFESDVSQCIDISELSNLSLEYDYINDIIIKSQMFFNHECINFKSYLIERLYDLDNIHKPAFSYYDVRKKKFGIIEVNKKNGIHKDGEKVNNIKSTYKEIKKIRKTYIKGKIYE